MKARRQSACALIALTAILLSSSGRGAITVIDYYRLGENDPGAASGLTVTNTTTDVAGVNHLKQFGGPLYTNAVSANASNRLGSSLSVNFNGINQLFSNAVVSTAVNNFGIEAWVKPNTTNAGTYFIVDNGFAGTGGWGMYQSGNSYVAFYGALAVFGSGAASPGTWAHLALVRDNGTGTLYVNGVASGTSALTPNPVAGGFAIGATPQPPALAFFNGAIDEVRVFTFAPGQFSTNDLLLNMQRIVTLPATGITATNATLNGMANPIGSPTSALFEWGTTTNYGNTTPSQVLGSGLINTNFSRVITNLVPGVTYNYRAVATNILGLAFGTNQSFTVPLFALAITNLPNLNLGAAAWGDYDNDGRLDLLLAGSNGTNAVTDVWRNLPGGFSAIGSGVTPVTGDSWPSAVAWGDFDRNGRLDIALAGSTTGIFTDGTTEVWANQLAGFSQISTPAVPDLVSGAVEWADYDNDGRLDLLTAGFEFMVGRRCDLWRNNGTNFSASAVPLPGFEYGTADWGDYDNDGDLDLLIAGRQAGAQLLRQTGGFFTNVAPVVAPGLPYLEDASVAWGDFDNDGRLDFLVAGSLVSQLWRNTGSTFTNVPIPGLPATSYGSLAWGDCDNDGRLDFLITGTTNNVDSGAISEVWRNTGNGFTNFAVLPGVMRSTAVWGDYDNDGRLDIALMGTTTNGGRISRVYRNQMAVSSNSPPSTPTGLSMNYTNGTALLSWNTATDTATPAAGISYNIRVGTAPGLANLVSPQADTNGFRRLPAMGNAQMRNYSLINGLSLGQTVYWSVQAVDTSFAGGPFAPEIKWIIAVGPLVETLIPIPVDTNSVFLRARVNPNATIAWFDWGTTTNLGYSLPTQSMNTNVFYEISTTLEGLDIGTTYYFRAAASNSHFGVVYGKIFPFTRGFIPAVTNLPGLELGSLTWGDYDNDGRLDLLQTGASNFVAMTDIWRNSPTGFVAIGSGLTGVAGIERQAAAAWSDYDNDGRLDVLLTGTTNLNIISETSKLWRNTGAAFAPTSVALPGIVSSTVEWGDYDNDGRRDFLLAGFSFSSGILTHLWRNTGIGFTNLAPLQPFSDGGADWGDFDNDGRLDLLVTGVSGPFYTNITRILRNTGAGFVEHPISLPRLVDSAAAWGDYDNDGRLDFLIAGYDGTNTVSQLWRNTGSTFTNVPIPGLPGVSFCTLAWGDYDSDGRLDFLITGTTNHFYTGAITEIWRNTGNGFMPTGADLPAISKSSAVWGDYDDDGRLDVALAGLTPNGTSIAQVFRCQMPATNSPPAVPSGLAMNVTNGTVVFSWNPASDAQTPAAGLSYNVRAGVTPGGFNLISPEAAANGYRRQPGRGNAQMRSFALLNGLTSGQRVFWSVQAVDTSFAGGPFAAEASFVVDLLVETLSAVVQGTTATLRGQVNPAATHAWFEWGTTTNLGTATPLQLIGGSFYTNIQQVLSELALGVTYHYRAVASNNLGVVHGAIRTFAPPGFASIQPNTNGLVEMNLGGPPISVYLIDASTNLAHWKLIACLYATNSPVYFVDPETAWFDKRFYRFRAFPALVQNLIQFVDNHTNFFSVLFRHPSFSGSTAAFVDTSPGQPNFAAVTPTFPGGLPATNVLHVAWAFTNGAVNPWLRLSTSNPQVFPNPIIDFGQGLCFNFYTDRDLYLALGLRETDSAGAPGGNGGTVGPIEWVGGTVNNNTNPPLGRLVKAGQWHRLCFFIPAEPVAPFTGNGILTSTTGRGVLEHIAIVPLNGTGTNHIYFGDF